MDVEIAKTRRRPANATRARESIERVPETAERNLSRVVLSQRQADPLQVRRRRRVRVAPHRGEEVLDPHGGFDARTARTTPVGAQHPRLQGRQFAVGTLVDVAVARPGLAGAAPSSHPPRPNPAPLGDPRVPRGDGRASHPLHVRAHRVRHRGDALRSHPSQTLVVRGESHSNLQRPRVDGDLLVRRVPNGNPHGVTQRGVLGRHGGFRSREADQRAAAGRGDAHEGHGGRDRKRSIAERVTSTPETVDRPKTRTPRLVARAAVHAAAARPKPRTPRGAVVRMFPPRLSGRPRRSNARVTVVRVRSGYWERRERVDVKLALAVRHDVSQRERRRGDEDRARGAKGLERLRVELLLLSLELFLLPHQLLPLELELDQLLLVLVLLLVVLLLVLVLLVLLLHVMLVHLVLLVLVLLLLVLLLSLLLLLLVLLLHVHVLLTLLLLLRQELLLHLHLLLLRETLHRILLLPPTLQHNPTATATATATARPRDSLLLLPAAPLLRSCALLLRGRRFLLLLLSLLLHHLLLLPLLEHHVVAHHGLLILLGADARRRP